MINSSDFTDELIGLCMSPEGADISHLERILSEQPQTAQARDTTMYKATPLHHACKNGASLSFIRQLTQMWPQALRTPDEYEGALPLHWACSVGKAPKDVIEFLLQENPDAIRVPNISGYLPLTTFCYGDYRLTREITDREEEETIDIFHMLYSAWPEAIKIPMRGGSMYPLHMACHGRAPCEIIRFLLERYPEAARDTNGNTALTYACCVGLPLSMIRDLVKAGPENARCMKPLYMACSNGYASIEVLRFLVQRYPGSVKRRGTEGNLPIHVARHPSHAEFLLGVWPEAAKETNQCGETPLHTACKRPAFSPELIYFLLQKYPQAARTADSTYLRRLPLHNVCGNQKRTPEGVRAVYEAYPEGVATTDNRGMLPLHVVVDSYTYRETANAEIIEFLCEKYPRALEIAVSLDYRGPIIPLHIAVSRGMTWNKVTTSTRALQALVDGYPASIFQPNGKGNLALDMAVMDREFDLNLVRPLFAGSCSPLHFACQHSRKLCTIRSLLKKDPSWSVSRSREDGDLPLHIACRDRPEFVPVLLKHNPETALMSNKQGWVALHEAAMADAPLDTLFSLLSFAPNSLRK